LTLQLSPLCVNLLEHFGDRVQVTFDPAYDAHGRHRDNLDPWMMQLPCAGHGVTIYPHGRELLAVEVNGRPGLARQLVTAPGVKLYQDGDGEQTFLFDAALFDQVAAVVRPRRRRRLTEAHRKALAENMARVRAAKSLVKTGPEARRNAPDSSRRPAGHPGAAGAVALPIPGGLK
jgi:hypothetical protein